MSLNNTSTSIYRKLVPGLLLGVLVFVGLALLGDLKDVERVILRFDWRYFPLALLLTLFNYTLRFVKWHFYLRQLGVRGLRWQRSLRLWVAGFPLAVTPGKVGEVLKGVWLNQYTGLPVARGVSVVVAERISDGLAVLALSTLGVIAYPQYWPAFLVILVLLLGVVVISQIRPLVMWLFNQGERLAWLRRITPPLREFYEGSFALFKPYATLVGVALGTISWLGEGVGFYFILRGLGLAPSTHLLATAIFVLAFSTIVGAASTLPGGLGAAEASIAGMLTLLSGIEPAVASTATLLIRMATLWFSVVLGLGMWAVSPDLLGIKSAHGTVVEG